MSRSALALMHLSGLLVWLGIPFGNVLGPLIIWQLKRDEDPILDRQGAAAVQFQIAISLVFVLGLATAVILVGIPVLIGAACLQAAVTLVAGIRAAQGKHVEYPFGIGFARRGSSRPMPGAVA